MNTKSLVVVGIIFLITLLCAGCVDNTQIIERDSVQEEEFDVLSVQHLSSIYTTVSVFHDNKRNVTCWRVGSGLSCIPDSYLSIEYKKGIKVKEE